MNGFVIAIVIIIVVFSSIASQKQKRNRARQSAAAPEQQAQQPAQPMRRQERKPLQPTVAQHVVTTSFASGHAHQETSMTGDVPCPPEQATAIAVESSEQRIAALLNAGDALRGIVYAEILGKPKALQKR